MILSIDEVNDILDEAYEQLPQQLFDGLNGGVLLLEDTVRDPESGDSYVLGHYCRDEMGRYINIYYGSFVELLRHQPREVWVEELRTTLRHELTHHVEGLAGDRSLEYKDAEREEELRSEYEARHGGKNGGHTD